MKTRENNLTVNIITENTNTQPNNSSSVNVNSYGNSKDNKATLDPLSLPYSFFAHDRVSERERGSIRESRGNNTYSSIGLSETKETLPLKNQSLIIG
jgi:hypothetical protein